MNAEISETIRARLLRFGINAEISETIRARLLRFGVWDLRKLWELGYWDLACRSELLTQRKFVSVDCHALISETMGARLLRFGVQIPWRKLWELGYWDLACRFLIYLTQRKFVSADCHAHSNAHKPPKTVAHYAAQVCFGTVPRPL